MSHSDFSPSVARSYHITSTFPPFEKTRCQEEKNKSNAYYEYFEKSLHRSPPPSSSSPSTYGYTPSSESSSSHLPTLSQKSPIHNPEYRSCGVTKMLTSQFPPFEPTRTNGEYAKLMKALRSGTTIAGDKVETEAASKSLSSTASTTGSASASTTRSFDGKPTDLLTYNKSNWKRKSVSPIPTSNIISFETTGARALPRPEEFYYQKKAHAVKRILTSTFPPFESTKYFDPIPPNDELREVPDSYIYRSFEPSGARELPWPPKLKVAPTRVPRTPVPLTSPHTSEKYATRPVSPETRRELQETVHHVREEGSPLVPPV